MSARPNILAIPSLKTFMVNAKSLALYRKALRVTKGMSPHERLEVRNVIRHEFESTRTVKEVSQVSYLHTTGKRRIQQLETQLSMQR